MLGGRRGFEWAGVGLEQGKEDPLEQNRGGCLLCLGWLEWAGVGWVGLGAGLEWKGLLWGKQR